MKIIGLLAVLALQCTIATAQYDAPYADYNWEDEPALHTLDSLYADEDEVTLKKTYLREFTFSDSGLEQINTVHTITKINSDIAIEDNNRIYLSVWESSSVSDQKARVIKANGDIIELKESDIQEAENDEGTKTRYFALEGLEIGAEVEYFYRTKTYPSLEGANIYIQSNTPQLDYEFKLAYPTFFDMETKMYNTEDTLVADTLSKYFNELSFKKDTIVKLKSEESAFYSPHLVRLAYKLKNNHLNGTKDVISYGTEASNFYDIYMTGAEKKDLKIINKFIKDSGVSGISDTEEKLRKYERYIKDNVQYVEGSIPPENAFNIAYSEKLANGRGLTRIFTNSLTELGVEYQLVLTCDRSSAPYDEEFQSYSSLQEFLIYFPELDKYLAPTQAFSCLGLIPAEWAANKGLFIEKLSLGGMETGLGKTKWIAAAKPEVTKDNMRVECDINAEDLLCNMTLERESYGYYAQAIQPIFPYLDEEQKEEASEGLAKWMNEDLEVENVVIENTASEDFGTKPLVVKATSETDLFISSAGDKLLFKLGELIGPQAEMYDENEEERRLPVDESYNRYYERDITVNIPEGYSVQNPDDMNIEVKHEREGKLISTFFSNYTIENNQIILHCEEYYTEVSLPKEEFEQYRSVINAAADFNKIVLVFKPV